MSVVLPLACCTVKLPARSTRITTLPAYSVVDGLGGVSVGNMNTTWCRQLPKVGFEPTAPGPASRPLEGDTCEQPSYLRQRDTLIRDGAAHIQRM